MFSFILLQTATVSHRRLLSEPNFSKRALGHEPPLTFCSKPAPPVAGTLWPSAHSSHGGRL